MFLAFGAHHWAESVTRALAPNAPRSGAHHNVGACRPYLSPGVVKQLPHDPTHVFIFYTAGALTHRMLPDHVPYAEKNGLWERVPDFKHALPLLKQYWQPYLDGTTTLDQALVGYAAAL